MKNSLSIILIVLWGIIISCKKDNSKKLLSVEKENTTTDTDTAPATRRWKSNPRVYSITGRRWV